MNWNDDIWMRMDEHTASLLDYMTVLNRTAEYTVSPEGRELCLAMPPLKDPVSLLQLKHECEIFAKALEENPAPESGFPDIERVLKKLAIEGMVLEIEELHALSVWIWDYEKILTFARKALSLHLAEKQAKNSAENNTIESDIEFQDSLVPLRQLIQQAPLLNIVYKKIQEILTPDGQLRDLPAIKSIQAAIARKNKEILTLAGSYSRNPELRDALQSAEPTQRDGRTLLAIRANFKGRIKGIVHEVSASGQTVFMEPFDIMGKNNELVELEAHLKAEIRKILRNTTEGIRPHRLFIDEGRTVTAWIDIRLARAIQAKRENLIFAQDCDEGLTLWKSRHPLLGKKAVPIDVLLPEKIRTLIITGPNTGGKTVTLKTIGLYVLMNQAGLGLPAAVGTKLATFDNVFADIGDEQSINQSLSTFSGHIKVISAITGNATDKSMVLLDELGAGTDPEEGCAMAMSLLDYFIRKGSLTIATTHHGILKNYGYTKPGCLNASMEFNSENLSPTYRIAMGIPGESRALDIASNMGLSQEIVEQARSYLSEERTNIGELIRGLSEKHREIELIEREQRKKLKAAVEDQRKADLALLRVRQKELELKRNGLKDMKKLLDASRKTLENLVRELREHGATAEKTREVKQFLADLAETVEEKWTELNQEETDLDKESEQIDVPEADKTAPATAGEFCEGMLVFFGSYKKQARLIRKEDSSTWLVEVGSLRMRASESDLYPLKIKHEQKPLLQIELAADSEGTPAVAVYQLDVRGMRLQDALRTVEKQIDAASLQGLNLFSIVHGTGEGILSRGIHEFLKQNPAVSDYYFARPEEGGFGKTIVRLSSD